MPWERVRERMLAGLHERGYTDLIAAHLNVLQYPGPDNTRPSELAARTHTTKQALKYLLGQLERLGYLAREDDEEDHRSKANQAHRRGQRAIEAIRSIVSEVETEWEHELGPESFTQLRNLLRQLTVVIGADSKTPAR